MTTTPIAKQGEPSPDVPIFLRKTYHMVDTCDPEVAGWSEDGETFVVKDPVKFERTIIPQFFKHSKFSSFVRQLNFYSFRKIKYADTIRIDPQLEAETANYWRFRHENFRRGRPDLLSEIKRMNGQKGSATKTSSPPTNAASGTTNPAVDAEVQALKKRIEEMNKNIDHLTAMVEKVNIKQEENEKQQEEQFEVMHKRKKVVLNDEPLPETLISATMPMPMMELTNTPEPLDAISSNTAMDDLDNLPPPSSMPLPDPAVLDSRVTSVGSSATDSAFVDQMLNSFGDDDVEFAYFDEVKASVSEPEKASNRPDPELMQRLSDALMVLPKEIQEMIVNRLIQSITSPDFEKNAMLAVTSTPEPEMTAVPVEMEVAKQREAAVPLAAATLAALLQHLCHQHAPASADDKGSSKNISKSLPVVPVHA